MQGKRPYEVLVAWRLCDMWPKLEKWLREMEILPCLERRDEAAVTSAAHGLHIEGRNNPVGTNICLSLCRVFHAWSLPTKKDRAKPFCCFCVCSPACVEQMLAVADGLRCSSCIISTTEHG